MSDRMVLILAGIALLVAGYGLYGHGSFDPWLKEAGRAARAVSSGYDSGDRALTAGPSAKSRPAGLDDYGDTACASAQTRGMAQLDSRKITLEDGTQAAEITLSSELPFTVVQVTASGTNIEHQLDGTLRYFEGSGTHVVGVIRQERAGAAWAFSLNWRWRPGADTRGARDSFRLPFAAGDAFRVSQAFGGSATHTGDARYAVDFVMPVGTPVHAARDGVVVVACGKHSEGGYQKEYLRKGNSISILHADGTRSAYGHLKEAGVLVEVGDTVEAGDLIGYSGNTGYSSGPHLHFQVSRVAADLAVSSVPFDFVAADGERFVPRAGAIYTAGP